MYVADIFHDFKNVTVEAKTFLDCKKKVSEYLKALENGEVDVFYSKDGEYQDNDSFVVKNGLVA